MFGITSKAVVQADPPYSVAGLENGSGPGAAENAGSPPLPRP